MFRLSLRKRINLFQTEGLACMPMQVIRFACSSSREMVFNPSIGSTFTRYSSMLMVVICSSISYMAI